MTAITTDVALARRVTRTACSPLATLVARRFAADRAHAARARRAAAHADAVRGRHRAGVEAKALHSERSSYESFVAIGTIGLLIPLNMMFSGLGVIVDRETGAQRELLAAPIARPLLVLGNLVVALAITALQVGVLIGVGDAARHRLPRHRARASRGSSPPPRCSRSAMYGVAETLAAACREPRSTSDACPAIAIVPWFLAGSLFPISALPVALTWVAKVLPLTHALALMRYGLLNDSERAPRHLGHEQPDRDGRAEPDRRRRVRRAADGDRYAGVRSFGRELSAGAPSGTRRECHLALAAARGHGRTRNSEAAYGCAARSRHSDASASMSRSGEISAPAPSQIGP